MWYISIHFVSHAHTDIRTYKQILLQFFFFLPFWEKLQTVTEYVGLPKMLYVFYEGNRIVYALMYWLNTKLFAA
jgi:hypothetical protein